MRKFNNLKIITYFVITFILSIVAPTVEANAVNADSNYDVKISYGIEGKYRALKYIPINIEAKALSDDFNGEVEVKVANNILGSYDSFSKEISIKSGESVNVNIPVKLQENLNKVVVCLTEDDKNVYEEKIILSSGRVNEGNVFAGVLSDDASALGYLGDIEFEPSNELVGKITTVNLSADIIGSNALNIDGLDLIIINNYNMSNLNEEAYISLNNWINNGGTLLIGAGANEVKTIGSINKSFFNINSNGRSDKNVTILGENLTLSLSDINIEDSNVLLHDKDNNLVYSKDIGTGNIIISTFDIGLEPFISSNIASDTMKNILNDTFNKFYEDEYKGNYSNGYYLADNLLNNLPINNIVGVKSLIIILIIYTLIVGVILYLVLKKFNKRELFWILVPVISIIFTFIVSLTSSKTKVNNIILNKVNIVNIDEEGKGNVEGYIGIANKNKSDLVVKKDSNLEMTPINDDYYYYEDQQTEQFKDIRLKTTFTNNNEYLTFYNNDALSMNKLKVSGSKIILDKIDNDFHINNKILSGYIRNNLDSNISHLLLVCGENIWDLGAINKGEEINIDENELREAYGLQAYAENIRTEYYNSTSSNKDEKYKNILRVSNLIDFISYRENLDNKTVLIAITDTNINYNLDLDSDSISDYNTTAILQDVDISFKDNEGYVNYPDGYFKGEIVSSDMDVNFDPYYGYIYGKGNIIFEFNIDKDIMVNKLILNEGTDRWNNTFSSIYYIYNYEKNQYEEITLANNCYNFENIDKYLKDNVLNIKLNVNGEKGEAIIPRITVGGCEK